MRPPRTISAAALAALLVLTAAPAGAATEEASSPHPTLTWETASGVSVSVSGDTVVVGSDLDDDSGSAYVFSRSGSVWTQQAKLTASDAAAGDFFGFSVSVSVSGGTAVVGAARLAASASESGSAYTFDLAPPDTFVTSGPPTVTSSTSATFEFFGTDNHTPSGSLTFACSLDSAPDSSCRSPVTYTGLADGSHTFLVKATDAAGNTDPTPATYKWSVDATPPDTRITSGPASLSSSDSATLHFTSTEPGSTFVCSLDLGNVSPCASPVSYRGLAEGSHKPGTWSYPDADRSQTPQP